MDIQKTVRESLTYSTFMQFLVTLSLDDFKEQVSALQHRRDCINDTQVVDERHIEILEEEMEQVQTKLQICRVIQPIVQALSIYRAHPVKNTFRFLTDNGNSRWVVKVVTHINTTSLAIGTSNTITFYPLEEVRALRRYLNVHEDDF